MVCVGVISVVALKCIFHFSRVIHCNMSEDGFLHFVDSFDLFYFHFMF